MLDIFDTFLFSTISSFTRVPTEQTSIHFLHKRFDKCTHMRRVKTRSVPMELAVGDVSWTSL